MTILLEPDRQAEWTRRHIAAFRTHRGHSACMVRGCTGSLPLVWVPTAREFWVWGGEQPPSRAVGMPVWAGG
jgi:hypothetical protein